MRMVQERTSSRWMKNHIEISLQRRKLPHDSESLRVGAKKFQYHDVYTQID